MLESIRIFTPNDSFEAPVGSIVICLEDKNPSSGWEFLYLTVVGIGTLPSDERFYTREVVEIP